MAHPLRSSFTGPPSMAPLSLFLLLLPLFLSGAFAGPMNADDVFPPICGSLLPDPPPNGYSLWSSLDTWGGSGIPGVGSAAGANVTIPCGVAVLLDVPAVQLTVLNISGTLKVQDDASLPLINLTASFIVVGGKFIIGSSAQQFRQRIRITLRPNPSNRLPLSFAYPLPAEPTFPRGIGHKAFAVVGGQVDFHGIPGDAGTPAWTRLAQHARVNDTSITVRGDASNWPIGGQIVIAPTDYAVDQDEARTITGVLVSPDGTTTISLDRQLAWNHYGDPLGVPDGFGGFIDETAEVALLTRNIVITGADEPAPYALEGGHFIVYFTLTPQFLEGVQFLLMGQQGTLGRYNIHFHMCGNQFNNSVVRRNVIFNSKQRCVVVHGTANLTVDSTVTYNTSGHCFMVEEGSEMGNTFSNNLAIRTRAATKLISSDESDTFPSSFWVSNPNNNYINNAIAGSDESGFWFELRPTVRGLSLLSARLNNTQPNGQPPGVFSGNAVHSSPTGFRTYSKGYNPETNATLKAPVSKGLWVKIGGFSFWKIRGSGVFLHKTRKVEITNSSFADCVVGVNIVENVDISITASRFVGTSNNYGTPQRCYTAANWRLPPACGPISGCSFPLPLGVPGRSVPPRGANQTILGVRFDENRADQGGKKNFLADSTFSGFGSPCKVSAAIGIGQNYERYWSTGNGFRNLSFAPGTNPIFLFPPVFTATNGDTYTSGDVANTFAIKDYDGSIVGAPGGYVVANVSGMLPPPTYPACMPMFGSNAYACPQTCYRTLVIMFTEYIPGNITLTPAYGPDPFSYFLVTRVADGVQLKQKGNKYYAYLNPAGNPNINDTDEAPDVLNGRFIPLVLLAGETYDVTFVPGTTNPDFVPSYVWIDVRDESNCAQGVTLRFKGNSSGSKPYSWTVQQDDSLMWTGCPGNAAYISKADLPIQYSYVCSASAGEQALEIITPPKIALSQIWSLFTVPRAPDPCANVTKCGLVAVNAIWAVNQQSANLQPAYPGGPAFYNPLFPISFADWKTGQGFLGSFPQASTVLTDPSAAAWTYYFRTMFNLTNGACFSQLYFDAVVTDGAVIYLNNVEILRINVARGAVSNTTRALSTLPTFINYVPQFKTYVVPLAGNLSTVVRDGFNYLAVQAFGSRDIVLGFKIYADLLLNCSASQVFPEVCDGLDNDMDGLIDNDPAALRLISGTSGPLSPSQLLQRPCSTACGTGFETCLRGAYQACSAPPVLPEVCNGIDDDCDGLIDEGQGQLDCPPGTVCFRGSCLPQAPLTTPQVLWDPQTGPWFYNDTGASMDASPSWRTGFVPSPWASGNGSFGVYSGLTFTTPLAPNSKNTITTRYFLRRLSLSPAEAAATYSIVPSVRSCDGAVIFLNGAEIFRWNMPNGTVTYATLAAANAATTRTNVDPNAVEYYSGPMLRSSAASATSGINWVAAELHAVNKAQRNWAFDLSLTRHATLPCPSGANDNSCVRNPPSDTVFISKGDTWAVADAATPSPSSDWATLAYNASSWPTARASLGYRCTTGINWGNRTAFYFRKAISIPDAACFYNLTFSAYVAEGGIIYINGVEVLRVNMPAGAVTPLTFAGAGVIRAYQTFNLTAAWLVPGLNVVGVEVHQTSRLPNNSQFDLSFTGQREAGFCTPSPP